MSSAKSLLLCALLGIGLCFGACGGGEEPGEFVLGVIFPLQGPNAQTGGEMLNSVKLAADEWNQSGKLGKWTCKVVALDDSGDSQQAASAAHDLCNSYPNLAAVVAHLNSGCFRATKKIYNDHRIAAMSPATTNPEITAGGFDNIFRVCATDDVQGGAAVQLFKELGLKKVALIHDRTPYGQPLTEVIEAGCKTAGIEVTELVGITVGDKDYKSVLTKVRAANPEAIYFGGMYDEGGLLVRQMRSLGMEQPFFGGDGLKGPAFTDAGGEASLGSRVSIIGPPIEEMGEGEASAYFEKYEKAFGMKVENFGPFAYDVANILLEAIARTIEQKGKPDRETVIAEAHKTDHNGVIGHTTFDEKGDTNNRVITFYEVYKNDAGALDFRPYKIIRP